MKIVFDVVYTWVDFSNEIWKKDYNEYYNKFNNTENYNIMNRSNSNLEELKYSLRSIEKYLKVEIGKIYIVTNYGSKPSFLKKRKDVIIINDFDLLGKISFNSQAIESVLHTIPNLNEYFIYFNDDFVLNNYVYQKDLIDNNGKLIWYSETDFFINLNTKINIDVFNLDSGVKNSRDYTYKKIFKKNNIGQYFVKSLGHCLRVFNKSMIEEFINMYINNINKTRNKVFRTNKLFCFIDGFYLHFLLNNKIMLKNDKKILILVQSDNYYLIEKLIEIKNIYSKYLYDTYDFICIEDIRKNNLSENTFIKSLLDDKLNFKSKYEK